VLSATAEVVTLGASHPTARQARGGCRPIFDRRPPIPPYGLRRLAPELSRETYLEAIEAAARAGRLSHPDLRQVARRAASEAPPAGETPRGVDLLLDGYATMFTKGDAAAAPILAAALAAFCDEPPARNDTNVQLAAVRTAASLRDEHAWLILATRLVQGARDAGALTVLPAALDMVAGLKIPRGHFDVAARLIQEEDAITTATGAAPLQYARVLLAGYRGDEDQTTALADAMLHETTAGRQGYDILAANLATAALHNGIGRYDLALKAALNAFEVDEDFVAGWAGVELIEAAVRSGDPDAASTAIRRLSAGASRTDWALGLQARVRALITDDDRLVALAVAPTRGG